MKRKSKYYIVYMSARDGRFVTTRYALRHPGRVIAKRRLRYR